MRTQLLIFTALLSVACSDATPPAPASTTMMPTPVLPGQQPGMTPTQPVMGMKLLQPLTESPLFVATSGSASLKVRYIANQTQPITNTMIAFEILDMTRNPAPNGINGTTLSALNTQTSALGEAEVNLIAGTQGAALFVRAYDPMDPSVTPVFFEVNVSSPDQGGLAVSVRYNQAQGRYRFAEFASAKVTLFNTAQVNCDTARQSAPRFQNAFVELTPIMPFNDIDNSVTGANLPQNQRYTVAALIYNQMGAPLTFGCIDDVEVTGGRSTPIDVMTTDLPLDFTKGTFNTLNRFNLIDGLIMSGDDSLETIGDIFEILRALGGSARDLGSEVISRVCSLADLGDSVCRFAGNIAGEIVGDAIIMEIPEDVREVLVIIGDVLDIVGDMTIVGEIEFAGAPNQMGDFPTSDHRWNKLRFEWEQGCTGNDCTREVTFSQLGRFDRAVAGTFEASIISGGNVQIHPHGFAIAYGNIILSLLEGWIIPIAFDQQPGSGSQTRLEDLLERFLPCESINESLPGGAGSGICEDILIAALGSVLRDQVSRLNFDADALTLEGTFTPVDTDRDLSVDQLGNGQWTGRIEGGLTFFGCFTGCLGMPCEGEPCMIMQQSMMSMP